MQARVARRAGGTPASTGLHLRRWFRSDSGTAGGPPALSVLYAHIAVTSLRSRRPARCPRLPTGLARW